MHLRAKDTLQLILHWGAKSKREPPGASIELREAAVIDAVDGGPNCELGKDIRSNPGGRAVHVEMNGSPIKREVANVFIPVRNIDRARAWYRDVLGLPVGEVEMGHLCSIPMDKGPGLLLDQKLTPDGAGAENAQLGAYPLFMFATEDVDASLAYLRARGVEVLEYGGTVIQNGHWFNFRDCEGNMLMVCAPY